ncbi:uncharacterized protein AMSG_03697 [Thecamonas trahens ATCC 50062]|uniref:F-box domain-containing protein n=1 Tax=Thecamonas trahens ATCC 50062 TaxID=461836 RepID=A0A0L0D4H4_THETB|nr:hypothetical protein AMSG_03697 [Thecamonas trahens ATCC 50062]KNC47267.1 hypothetical protein AMSG_03697 [Thecamonas trahens ATCC 50062]|eukprot:XP_013759610.1 hypothetical protein AMSG_03697 [Thecamonas trahens ATCC 50062]
MPKEPRTFDSLPVELVLYAFSLLDRATLGRAAQVARKWHALANDGSLWRVLDLVPFAARVDDSVLVRLVSAHPAIRILRVAGSVTDAGVAFALGRLTGLVELDMGAAARVFRAFNAYGPQLPLSLTEIVLPDVAYPRPGRMPRLVLADEAGGASSSAAGAAPSASSEPSSQASQLSPRPGRLAEAMVEALGRGAVVAPEALFVLDILASAPRLRRLVVRREAFECGDWVVALAPRLCPKLEVLELGDEFLGEAIEGLFSVSVAALRALAAARPPLRELVLTFCKVFGDSGDRRQLTGGGGDDDGSYLDALSGLEALEVLRLRQTDVLSPVSRQLGLGSSFDALRVLEVPAGQLTEREVNILFGAMPVLEEFVVSAVWFLGTDPDPWIDWRKVPRLPPKLHTVALDYSFGFVEHLLTNLGARHQLRSLALKRFHMGRHPVGFSIRELLDYIVRDAPGLERLHLSVWREPADLSTYDANLLAGPGVGLKLGLVLDGLPVLRELKLDGFALSHSNCAPHALVSVELRHCTYVQSLLEVAWLVGVAPQLRRLVLTHVEAFSELELGMVLGIGRRLTSLELSCMGPQGSRGLAAWRALAARVMRSNWNANWS